MGDPPEETAVVDIYAFNTSLIDPGDENGLMLCTDTFEDTPLRMAALVID